MGAFMLRGFLALGVCYLMLRWFLIFMICAIVYTIKEARTRLDP